jgi:hypothetical protein
LQVFDASAIVYAWDNYPIEHFPALWEWLAVEIKSDQLQMSQVALEEVGHVSPDCRAWLGACQITNVSVSVSILHEANRMKGLIGVSGDDFHADGVDENDLLIIATAKVKGVGLVSDEKQPTPPQNKKKYKIPSVFRLDSVTVECIPFLEYLKRSGAVFTR